MRLRKGCRDEGMMEGGEERRGEEGQQRGGEPEVSRRLTEGGADLPFPSCHPTNKPLSCGSEEGFI